MSFDAEPSTAREWLEGVFLPERESVTRASWAFRGVLWVVLLGWGADFVLHGIDPVRANGSFLHGVNLVFHEAGHVIFALFGRFVGILGGSLGQLLMPLVCLLVLLLKTRDAFGASVAAWWLGQSHVDLAPYIDDARAQRLELLGGGTGRETGAHDWNNILLDLNVLRWDHAIARIDFAIGAALIVGSITWGAAVLVREHRRLREEGE